MSSTKNFPSKIKENWHLKMYRTSGVPRNMLKFGRRSSATRANTLIIVYINVNIKFYKPPTNKSDCPICWPDSLIYLSILKTHERRIAIYFFYFLQPAKFHALRHISSIVWSANSNAFRWPVAKSTTCR